MRILGRIVGLYWVGLRVTLSYMVQRSFKLSEELDERLVAAAVRDDRAVSYVIVKALEQALPTLSERPGRLAATSSSGKGSPEVAPTRASRARDTDRGVVGAASAEAPGVAGVSVGVAAVVKCSVCGRSSASTQWGCPEHGYGKVHPVTASGEWR